MILDPVENDEYGFQNTLHSSEIESSPNHPVFRIDRQKRYYGYFDMMNNSSGVVSGQNGEFWLMTNELHHAMNEEE